VSPDRAAAWAGLLARDADELGVCFERMLAFDDADYAPTRAACRAWIRVALMRRRRDRGRRERRRGRPAPLHLCPEPAAGDDGLAAVDRRDELAARLAACPPALERMLRVYAHAGTKADAARLLGYRHRQAFTRRLDFERKKREFTTSPP